MILRAISFCVPIASIVTIHPSRHRMSKSSGIVFISFVFFHPHNWPSTRDDSTAHALTVWIGLISPASSLLRLAVLPSIATTPFTLPDTALATGKMRHGIFPARSSGKPCLLYHGKECRLAVQGTFPAIVF